MTTYEELLGLLQPSAEEKKRAIGLGLLNFGAGTLANNYGHYGMAGPALGAGLQSGIQGYTVAQQNSRQNRLGDIGLKLKLDELQKEQEKAKQTQDLVGSLGQPTYSSGLNYSPGQGLQLGNPNPIPETPQARQAKMQQLAFANPALATAIHGLQPENLIGKVNPADFATGNLERFKQTGNFGDLGMQIDKRPVTNVNTKVNSFTPASEEAQKRFMDKVSISWESLKDAPATLDNIAKAKALVPQAGGFVGSGGEVKLAAVKFLNNNLGLNIDPQGVKSAEELRSRMFFQILDNLKKMDAQPSQQQQKVMMEALGNLGTDPQAIPKVLDAFAGAIRQKVSIHNQTVRSANKVQFPFDPIINLPAVNSGWAIVR